MSQEAEGRFWQKAVPRLSVWDLARMHPHSLKMAALSSSEDLGPQPREARLPGNSFSLRGE